MEISVEIVFVVSALHGGGAERVIVTLANQFAGRGDKVIILMTAGDEVAYRLEEAVEVVSIGQPSNGKLSKQIERILKMRSFFKDHADSKIVSFTTTINMFTILAAAGLKNKVIVSERNDPNRCNFKPARNLVYSLGKNFVFQTKDAMQCFPKKIRERSAVIPNPVRKDLPEIYTGIREKKIAAVGRLEPQKNHQLLLEAFAGFQQKFPEYELHIFGKGRLEQELKQRAADMGIGDKVIFEGFCSNVPERIRTYSMYVLSSDYEGISNSLMEAMALGIPCISTDCPIGGSALCIESGQNGLLVPTGNAEELCDAMELLARDTALAEQLGKNASAVRIRFGEESICRQWREYILHE